jgi:hypothetical protein
MCSYCPDGDLGNTKMDNSENKDKKKPCGKQS